MSKRSAAFKKNVINQAKKEILEDMRDDYSKEFNDHGYTWKTVASVPINEAKTLSKLAKMLGGSVIDLVQFINKNFKENAFDLVVKKTYKSLSEAFNAGERKEKERHLKAEDEAFQRGKAYGAEQRENELRAKYTFIEKSVNHDDQWKPQLNNEKPPYNNCEHKDYHPYSGFKYESNFPCFDGFSKSFEAFDKGFEAFNNALKHFKF